MIDNIAPTLCLDFDGVIHSYTSGWKGFDVIPDPPVDGAIEKLWEYTEYFKVVIYSTRNSKPEGINAMREWLGKYDDLYWKENPHLPQPRTGLVFMIDFPTEKPPAFVGIDDRIITFTGEFPSVEDLIAFKPWNKGGETKTRADRLEEMIDRMSETIVDLKAEVAIVNSLLRSAFSIASRNGDSTNWDTFYKKVKDVLEREQALMKKYDIRLIP